MKKLLSMIMCLFAMSTVAVAHDHGSSDQGLDEQQEQSVKPRKKKRAKAAKAKKKRSKKRAGYGSH